MSDVTKKKVNREKSASICLPKKTEHTVVTKE